MERHTDPGNGFVEQKKSLSPLYESPMFGDNKRRDQVDQVVKPLEK